MKKHIISAIIVAVGLSILMSLPVAAIENTKKTVLIDSCDNGDNWGHLQVDIVDKKEGVGSVLAFGTMCQFVKTFPQSINPGIPMGKAILEFWMYVEDPKFLKSEGQIELNSSGKMDTDEFHWYLTDSDLVTGWNYISLPFSEADKDGNPNINNLKMMRIYQFGSKIVYMKLDNVTITNEKTIVDKSLLGQTINSNSSSGDQSISTAIWPGFGSDKKQSATPYLAVIIACIAIALAFILVTVYILKKAKRKQNNENE